jgi:hypothetical protein
MKKSLILLILVFTLVMGVGFVSADLFVGPMERSYHMGDELNLTITLGPVVNTNDFLILKLICVSGIGQSAIDEVLEADEEENSNETDNGVMTVEEVLEAVGGVGGSEVEIYKSPYSVGAGDEKEVFVSIKLDKFLVGDLRGLCSIRAVYGGEEINSKEFEISRVLEVSAEVDGVLFAPGEKMGIKGNAYRKNGVPVNGFVEARIVGTDISVSGTASDGAFDLNFTVLKDMKARGYEVRVRAYEKNDKGDIINEGMAQVSFEVKQVIKKLEVSFDGQSVTPGNEFPYRINLIDQAGDQIQEDITLNIYRPDELEFSERLVRSGEALSFNSEQNFTPGYWTISARIRDVESERIFLVEDLELASFELNNNTLIVKNIGNVRYTKPVEISIGGVSEVKDMSLDLGEIKRFRLSAPDGEYNIEINDGRFSDSLGSAFLTGSAIRISSVGLVNSLKDKFSLLVWIFVIVIAGIVALILFRKIRRKAFFGKTPKLVKSVSVDEKSSESKVVSDATSTTGAIDNGVRQECSVVSLKVKNLKEVMAVDKEVIHMIDKGLLKAKDLKAKIYVVGDYRILIYSPIVTGEEDNNIVAINSAKNISDILNEYNAGHEKKLDFGVGVNVGEMIVERKEGKFRFTSSGRTIPSAKSASGKSTGDVLISKEVHGKVVGRVKSDKHPGENYWIVKRVVDRSKHKAFVERFKSGKKDSKEK